MDDAADAPAAAPDDDLCCAICLESTELAALPCCDGDAPASSTTRFCLACLRLLVDHAGGVARCPRCRAWISIAGDAVVEHDGVGRCVTCQQERVIVLRGTDRGRHYALCDACFFGHRLALRYECQGCGGVQRIPHPMWRYQVDGPESFGHTPWACHVRCETFTNWRVLGADAHLVPADDAPESWGRPDAIARVRALRRGRMRAEGVRRRAPPPEEDDEDDRPPRIEDVAGEPAGPGPGLFSGPARELVVLAAVLFALYVFN
mmetsp:Transcript_17882/g.53208  ORF Transcript_17882/g.53208 Transcript_17882/m.53208 type:complete len:262 (-) Transcript_17882:9-794(-)